MEYSVYIEKKIEKSITCFVTFTSQIFIAQKALG
ncbi:MAG: hypothetical protein ACI90V_013236, partial [Bacillariaceae sp.]